MKDKHFLSAMVLLVLPLSFGMGTTAGTKAAGAFADAEANHFQSLRKTTAGSHGFTVTDVTGRFSTGDTDYDLNSTRPVRTFVSSLEACGHSANRNGDCLSAGDAPRSTSGFPMYDSFKGSERSEFSRSTGSLGLIGPGAGGGGGGGPIGSKPGTGTDPIVTPEPGTIALLGLGLLSMIAFARRHRPRVTA